MLPFATNYSTFKPRQEFKFPFPPMHVGYTGAGCPVCGYGRDFTYYPEWHAIKTGTWLTCFVVGWMAWEYLCVGCVGWATKLGAKWDGRLSGQFGFTGWKPSVPIPDSARGAQITGWCQ